ncbi:hypothetical protein ACRS52_02460 [Bacillus cytotoxicus]|uniref:Uncharacterized protein n=1 Tax=Bacillus cytotoxicus TaxID=580165 RepID=A0AAX2CD53_9BACI|nr:hypothetical protein [Bacillus cytotoxicus]QTR83235.1 hypothetical protein JC777_01260 [Bacillus cytotoxicus]QTR86973.1 hypothetical protein JC774_21280 [Bacillus cytotoxicus]SCL85882.1 Uncharacterized protein BCB44BAC_00847 [Bacillus cytotoxicus]
MVHVYSKLYEISMGEPQKLIWHRAKVKRGNNVFIFDVYRTCATISVFYIDQSGKQWAIASAEEIVSMLVFAEDRERYQSIIGNVEWVLMDGIFKQRGMTKEEEGAFWYLKEHVLDEMVEK